MTIIEEDKLLKQVARLEAENNKLRMEIDILKAMGKERNMCHILFILYALSLTILVTLITLGQ